jgi:hypothetical protein
MHISYFDFVDEFYPEENQIQTISKEKWVKEDNTVVSSSHPPQVSLRIGIPDLPLRISSLRKETSKSQFAVSADKLYEWNIDGLAEQQILDKLTHMTMVSSSYVMNHDLSQPEVVDLLVGKTSHR